MLLHLAQGSGSLLAQIQLFIGIEGRSKAIVRAAIARINLDPGDGAGIHQLRLLTCCQGRGQHRRCSLCSQLGPLLSGASRKAKLLGPLPGCIAQKIATVHMPAHTTGNTIAIRVPLKAHAGLGAGHGTGLVQSVGIKMLLSQRIHVGTAKGFIGLSKTIQKLQPSPIFTNENILPVAIIKAQNVLYILGGIRGHRCQHHTQSCLGTQKQTGCQAGQQILIMH